MHVVVANLLETRKDRVWLVRRAVSNTGDAASADSRGASDSRPEGDGDTGISGVNGSHSSAAGDAARDRHAHSPDSTSGQTSKVSVQVIDRPEADGCIEVQLVGRIVRLHGSYLQSVNQLLMRSLMASLSASRR